MRQWKKRMLSVMMGVALLIGTGTVFADEFNGDAVFGSIEVFCGGRRVELTHAVFEDNQELYFPLREILNACGIPDDMITYENGVVGLYIWSPVLAAMPDKADHAAAFLTVGQPDVVFPLDQEEGNVNYNGGIRTTTHPTLLIGDTTYVSLGTLIRIRQFDVNKEWYYNGAAVCDRLRLQLLADLKIVRYRADGTYDVLLSPVPKTTEENRCLPSAYYEEGERVLIAGGAEMDAYGHHYDEVNGYIHPIDPIKRILVDDGGQVIAVVPVENQYHEALNASGNGSIGGGISWQQYAESGGGVIGLVGADGSIVKCDEIIHDTVVDELGSRMVCVYYLPVEWTVK